MLPPFPDASPEILAEVAREYEASLAIPKEKQSPQWMLMPVGLLGSGKTTIVKPLAEQLDLIRFSTDEVREKLRIRGYSYEGCREIVHELSKKYLTLGYSVAIDANTGSQFGLGYNKKTAEAFPHVRQLFIHINPPEDFIVNKLKNYKHTWLFKDGQHAVERFYFYKNTFKVPDVPFVFTFDPSRDDVPKQLEECEEAIKKVLQ